MAPASGGLLAPGRRCSGSATVDAARSAGRSAAVADESSSSVSDDASLAESPSSGADFGVVTFFSQSGVSTGCAGACRTVSAGRASERAGAVRDSPARAVETPWRSAGVLSLGVAAAVRASSLEVSRAGVERASVEASRRATASPFPSEAARTLRRVV